jgi:hypothetical protein
MKPRILYKQTFQIENESGENRSFPIVFASPEDLQTGKQMFECLTEIIKARENELESIIKLLPYKRRTCKNPDCNIKFLPNRKNQKFHTDKCKKAYYNKRRRSKKPLETDCVSNK